MNKKSFHNAEAQIHSPHTHIQTLVHIKLHVSISYTLEKNDEQQSCFINR